MIEKLPYEELVNKYRSASELNKKYVKEIERLHSIIKEVREYILNTKMFTYGEEKEFFLKDYWYGKELLEISNKINEVEVIEEDKKIQSLPIIDDWCEDIPERNQVRRKINEIIDYINEEK